MKIFILVFIYYKASSNLNFSIAEVKSMKECKEKKDQLKEDTLIKRVDVLCVKGE